MKKLILLIGIMLSVSSVFAQATKGALSIKDTAVYKPPSRHELLLDSGLNLQLWNKVNFKQVAVTSYGAITQITSGTTTVVKNASRGTITTVALTTAADASFQFTFTNSTITATSVILLTGLDSGNGVINTSLVSQGSGTCVIRVTNTGTAAFNSLVKIHFVVL